MGPRKKQLKVSEPSLETKTDDKPTKSSKATTSSTKTKKIVIKQPEKVVEVLEDSLKENQIVNKSEDVEMMSSSDDFESLSDESDSTSKKKSKKSKAKPKKKAEPAKKVNSPLKTVQKPMNILDSIDQMLLMETQSKHPKKPLNKTIDDEDDSDFEEVEMGKGEAHLAEMLKRNDGIEINVQSKKAKKEVDYKAKMERMFKAAQKQLRITMIKTHIVGWITHGYYLNKLCSDEELCALALSYGLEPKKFQLVNFNKKILCDFLAKINKKFEMNKDSFNKIIQVTKENLSQSISDLNCINFLQYILIVLIILRNQGIKVRLCVCFDVMSLKQQSPKATTSKGSSKSNQILSSDEEEEEEPVKKTSKKRKSETEIKSKNTKKPKVPEKSTNKRRLSSKLSALESSAEEEEETESQTNEKSDKEMTDERFYWLEVYLEEEKTWISVDPFDLKLTNSSPSQFEDRFGKKVLYVCAFDNDLRVKDVTKRYASDWEVSTRLLRISHLEEKKLWYEKMLLRLQPIDAILDIEEEQQLKKMRLKKELPQTVSEYKDHPLYVLKRHLLKFQSIYPENAEPVGDFRNESVFSRDNMATLHSRQTWLKFARVVKPFEKAYKIVKGRLKQSEIKQGLRENPDLDLYGYWQTKEYEPPFAENGRVPRNEFGNVELFQPQMLPIGCIHIKGHPNMSKVCRKLNVDCVAAVVGFDAHGGYSFAVMNGWVICSEHKEAVMLAYEQEEIEANKRLIEKQQERVWNNWKKLIKRILIREHIKIKYNNKITTNKHGYLDNEDDDKVKMEIDLPVEASTSKQQNLEPLDKEETKSLFIKKQPVKKSAPKTEPKVEKPKATRAKPKPKSKPKRDEYEEQDEEEYKSEPESDYEDIKPKKKRTTAAKKNPPRKAATKGRTKKQADDEPIDDEPVDVKQIVRKESPVKKSMKDEDDDLNLSNEDD